MTTPLGYSALISNFNLKVPPLAQSYILASKSGTIRHITNADGTERIEIPKDRYKAGFDLVAQLTFALKRERLDLTVLAAVFEHSEAIDQIQRWLSSTPTSTYARLAAHLAKWLTGANFAFTLPPGAPRVRVLDEAEYITGPEVPDTQLGVINNLLGSKAFCPLVRRSVKLQELLARNLRNDVIEALSRIDPEVLIRAVDYLYLSETRSTFSIEREIPDSQRASRFRQLLESAGTPGKLNEEQLCNWQNSVMSVYATEVTFRTTQNWLSRSGRLKNIADYIPPPPEHLKAMTDGVANIADLGANNVIDPAIAAACAAFGFVFIHPFLDGNGRVHRFLIHHILRQSGITPQGVVLPVSARMLKNLVTYSTLLKRYSAPRTALLDYLLDDDSQAILVRSPQPLWLYASFDATEICEFLLTCIAQCVEEDLVQEVKYLEAYDHAKSRLETWLDLPQPKLSLLVRLVAQGKGKLSERKKKAFEHLDEKAINRAEEVVTEEFAEYFELFGAVVE